MEPDKAQSIVDTRVTAAVADTKDQIRGFLADNTAPLLSNRS
jgi:hypothetical protein